MSDAIRLQRRVQDAMDAILVAHDRNAVRRHFHPDFVQHNPWAEDGGAHVEAMCDFTFGVEMKRWAIQGDLVAYHGLYTAPNPLGDQPLVCVDVWRVQGERIVEHWDVLQPSPEDVAAVLVGGPGDGLADVEPDRVAANVANVRRLLEIGVNRRQLDVIHAGLAEGFSVHRPNVEPGAGGLVAWVENAAPRVEVKRTIASGDLVFAQLLVEAGGAPQVVFDIFRFDEAGAMTDLWLVAQPIVPRDQAANPHPHF